MRQTRVISQSYTGLKKISRCAKMSAVRTVYVRQTSVEETFGIYVIHTMDLPPNKSARSQQWETGNRPSNLNKVCLAAKGSLIRTAQTDHEIQADAQDSQD